MYLATADLEWYFSVASFFKINECMHTYMYIYVSLYGLMGKSNTQARKAAKIKGGISGLKISC